MYIYCQNCEHIEPVNRKLFIKLIGGTFVGGGYWAWTAYLFAGTGLAMPICVAIVAGGVAMLAFSDQIVAWIAKKYDCPKCQKNQWIAVDDNMFKMIMTSKSMTKKTNQKDLTTDTNTINNIKTDIKTILFKLKQQKTTPKNQEEIHQLVKQIEGLQFLLEKQQQNNDKNNPQIQILTNKIQEKILEIQQLTSSEHR